MEVHQKVFLLLQASLANVPLNDPKRTVLTLANDAALIMKNANRLVKGTLN